MSLMDDIKGMQQTIADFIEKMDSIRNRFRSEIQSLQVAGRQDRSKTEVKLKNPVDSRKDEIETPKVNRVQPRSPEYSDDDFCCGPVSVKPKKRLCLSIKRSAKNRTKCATDRRSDVTLSDEWKVPKNQTNSEDKTTIAISWTIKIKESSAQQTNQVCITGSEQIDRATAGSGKSQDAPKQCNKELEFVKSISKQQSSNELTEILETVEALNDEDVNRCRNENEHKDFEECRVVIRKLSTSRKIFQPKVVLQKLTNDEIDRICGFQGTAEKGNYVQPERVPKVRYTSLILEPARKSLRVFSTVKIRCSVTRLVLTTPQVIKPVSATETPMLEQSCNEMVKSMFKRSKCVQEWRARVRTKDAGQFDPNARKSLDSQNNPSAIQWTTGTSRSLHETKPSKCPQGKERALEAKRDQRSTLNLSTVDSQNKSATTFGKAADNAKIRSKLMKTKGVVGLIPRVKDIDENDARSDQESSQKNIEAKNMCKSVKFEKLQVKKESDLKEIPEEPKSKTQDKKRRIVTQNPDGAGAVPKYQPNLADSIQELENPDIPDCGNGGLFTKSSTGPGNVNAIESNLTSSPRRGKAWPTHRGGQNKSPPKMVLITPTRLKYTVKTRNVFNATPIHSGRVTRSRVETDARTYSGSRPKNGNMFPGSQLTFLIESFRR